MPDVKSLDVVTDKIVVKRQVAFGCAKHYVDWLKKELKIWEVKAEKENKHL
jgi:hypothetical protein